MLILKMVESSDGDTVDQTPTDDNSEEPTCLLMTTIPVQPRAMSSLVGAVFGCGSGPGSSSGTAEQRPQRRGISATPITLERVERYLQYSSGGLLGRDESEARDDQMVTAIVRTAYRSAVKLYRTNIMILIFNYQVDRVSMFGLDEDLTMTRQDLTIARQDLATTRTELSTTAQQLTDKNAELELTKTSLVLAEEAHKDCHSIIDGLKSDVTARNEELAIERSQVTALQTKVDEKEEKLIGYKKIMLVSLFMQIF